MTTTKPNDSCRLLSARELAELLGLSLTSIYRLVERREIAFIRLPRGLRFRQEEVDAFLACRTVERVD